jgi:hypothetical protein
LHLRGLPELTYPFHDRDILVTACGRICMHRKKINVSTVLAGQRLGIREVTKWFFPTRLTFRLPRCISARNDATVTPSCAAACLRGISFGNSFN